MKKILALAALASVVMTPMGDDGSDLGGAAPDATPPAKAPKKPGVNGKDLLIDWMGGEGDAIKEQFKEEKLTRSHLKSAVDAAKGAKEGSVKAIAAAEIQAFLDETSKGSGGGPRKWTPEGQPLITVTEAGSEKNPKGILRVTSAALNLGAVYLPPEIDAAGNIILSVYTGPIVEGANPAGDKDEA